CVSARASYRRLRCSWFAVLSFSLEVGIEAIETAAPEAAVEIQPLRGARQRFASQAAATVLAVPLVQDQRGPLQHLEVPRDRGQRDLERFGEFADRQIPVREACEDRAAGRIGK